MRELERPLSRELSSDVTRRYGEPNDPAVASPEECLIRAAYGNAFVSFSWESLHYALLMSPQLNCVFRRTSRSGPGLLKSQLRNFIGAALSEALPVFGSGIISHPQEVFFRVRIECRSDSA